MPQGASASPWVQHLKQQQPLSSMYVGYTAMAMPHQRNSLRKRKSQKTPHQRQLHLQAQLMLSFSGGRQPYYNRCVKSLVVSDIDQLKVCGCSYIQHADHSFHISHVYQP